MTQAGVKCVNSAVQQFFVRPNPGAGGYSDIFIHTLARSFFGGFKILKFNIFWSFQKN